MSILLPKLLSLCRPVVILPWFIFFMILGATWFVLENPALQSYLEDRKVRDYYRDQVKQLRDQELRGKKELAQIKVGGPQLEKTIYQRCPVLKEGEDAYFFVSPNDKNQAAQIPRVEDFSGKLTGDEAAALDAAAPEKTEPKTESAPAPAKSNKTKVAAKSSAKTKKTKTPSKSPQQN